MTFPSALLTSGFVIFDGLVFGYSLLAVSGRNLPAVGWCVKE